jgi:hypothetical protein
MLLLFMSLGTKLRPIVSGREDAFLPRLNGKWPPVGNPPVAAKEYRKGSDDFPGEMNCRRLITPIWIHLYWDAPMSLLFPLEIALSDAAR